MMRFDAWFTLFVVVVMFVIMVRGVSTAASIMGAVAVLLVFGVIDERQAFSGFSNAAPITLAALQVVARAI